MKHDDEPSPLDAAVKGHPYQEATEKWRQCAAIALAETADVRLALTVERADKAAIVRAAREAVLLPWGPGEMVKPERLAALHALAAILPPAAEPAVTPPGGMRETPTNGKGHG